VLGAITAAAGLIAGLYGPTIGGLFLAFPSILPASLTLVAHDFPDNRLFPTPLAGGSDPISLHRMEIASGVHRDRSKGRTGPGALARVLFGLSQRDPHTARLT
jgi:hypothetical protein